jgi:hypothetical protein
VSISVSPSSTRDDRGVVDVKDVVVSGCGRVYVFPPSVPQSVREAGFNHLAYRAGYVERCDERWLPRDFGNTPLSDPRWRRVDALKVVLSHAGWRVQGVFPSEKLAPTDVLVAVTGAVAPVPMKVLIAGDGRVFVAIQRGLSGPARNYHWVGFVWRSGDHLAALGQNEESSMSTSHRTMTDALTRLATCAGYVVVASLA